MAFTVLDAAKSNPFKIKAGILATIFDTSPQIVGSIPLETDGTIFTKWIREGDLPDPDFRGYNEPHPEDQKGELLSGDLTKKPLGSKIAFDDLLADEPTHIGVSDLVLQLRMHSRAIGMNLKKYLVQANSATNSKQFDGFNAWIARHGGTNQAANNRIQAFAGSDAGATILSGSPAGLDDIVNSMNEFIDKNLEFGIPDFLVVTREQLNALHARATVDAANNVLAKMFSFRTEMVQTPLGAKKMRYGVWGVEGMDPIPMYPIDYDSQKVAIIGQNEAAKDTTGSTFSSMYAVSIGDGGVMLRQKYKDSIRMREESTSIGTTYHMDWPLDLLCEHPSSISRMSGIGI